jgi:hypothetical protein
MQGDGSRHIVGGALGEPCGGPCGRPCGGPFGFVGRAILCLTLCLLAGGCGAISPLPGLSAQARDTSNASIAFESIDGLPSDISQQLVHDLNEEAAALSIAVMPAGSAAAYRLRGYLAAHAQGSTTSIAWVWDVYDAELHRAFRLSGEERAAASGATGKNPEGKNPEGKTWATADEALLRRVARTGMEQLAGFVASPAQMAPAPSAPERSGAAVASRDAPPPRVAGLFASETAAAPRLPDAAFGR